MLDGDVNSPFGRPEEAPENGKIKMRLICPLYEVAAHEADKVLLPAAAGDILILPERAPIFIYLRAGRMVVYNKGEPPISYFISSGIAEVRRNLCPVLAWGVQEDKVNVKMIAAQLAESKKVLSSVNSDMGKHEIVSRIEFFETILKLMHYEPETVITSKSKGKNPFNPYHLKTGM
ncbi:MAG: F0F1 ATP synthase subunit epsilon [Alphaproteobacteria bacterium]